MTTISERMTYLPMLTLARSPLSMILCWRMAWSQISMLLELLIKHFFPIRFLDIPLFVEDLLLEEIQSFFGCVLSNCYLTNGTVCNLAHLSLTQPNYYNPNLQN